MRPHVEKLALQHRARSSFGTDFSFVRINGAIGIGRRCDFRFVEGQHHQPVVTRFRAGKGLNFESRPVQAECVFDCFTSQRSIFKTDQAHVTAQWIPEDVTVAFWIGQRFVHGL